MTCVGLLPEHDVLCVRLSGTVSVSQRAAALEALLDIQARTACRKVLIDFTDVVLLDGSHVETLEHAARRARSSVMQRMRIAYVGQSGSASSLEFAGGVARLLLPALPDAGGGVALAVRRWCGQWGGVSWSGAVSIRCDPRDGVVQCASDRLEPRA